jgi:twitching motility protein PilT
MIDYININFERHIITMEEPIEYYHQHKKSIVVQREIGVDVPSFSEALRRALRQDPDVMLVGEMRDLATISAAITAAETGHLVFGTLHTSGAASTINRIIDAFPTDQQEQVRVQLAGNMIAVLSQCLCPRVDTDGMVAGYEFMYVTPGIQNLIRENKSFRIDSEIQTGKRFGMQLLDDNLWGHYAAGRISVDEMMEKCRVPAQMIDKLERTGIRVKKKEGLDADEEEDEGTPVPAAGGTPPPPPAGARPPSPAAPESEAERQAKITANRARMAAMKK